MDFPKDSLHKKKVVTSTQPLGSKSTAIHHNQQPTLMNNRGKIRIEQYEYDQENILGQGFSSKVYLGRLAQNSRKQFAIKVVDKRKLGKIKENLELLEEQIKVHKQLEHPNIVKCYEIIEKPNFYFFILEHCPHGTLDSFIKKHQKLSESVTISIMEQIISAYKYLLEMKVIHRDLKPPNILKSGPTWKICDFGFSLIGKKNFVGELNVGTPAYMAPEALQRTYYSPKTDFFSLGVVCYEMLFGVTPWQHKNEKILIQQMKEKKLETQIFSGLKNHNLINFITKCCEINERKRIKMEQFEAYDFWRDSDLLPVRSDQFERIRPLSKTLCVKDYPSTNPSKASKNSAMLSGTRSDKSISIEELFKGNSAVVERQIYFAQILHNLVRHHAYMLFEESSEKELYLTVLSKHESYILRRIKNDKVNYLSLKKWKQYQTSKEFSDYKNEVLALDSSLKDLLSTELKKKTIQTIRQVNKKFDDLTYDQGLSLGCMTNLKEYVIDLMQKTLKRFDQNGKRYILDNPWTVQILDYLLQYYRYVGDTLKTAAESRIIALKEEETRDRETILEDFNKSKLRYSDFQSLKEQINILQI